MDSRKARLTIVHLLGLTGLLAVASCNQVVKIPFGSVSLDQFAVGQWQSSIEASPDHPSAELDVDSRNTHSNLDLNADKTFSFNGDGHIVKGRWVVANHQLTFSPETVDGFSAETVKREGKVYLSLARFHVQSPSDPPMDPTPILRAKTLARLSDMGALKADSDGLRLTQAAAKGDLQIYWYRQS